MIHKDEIESPLMSVEAALLAPTDISFKGGESKVDNITLITIRDAAKLLEIHPETFRRHRAMGLFQEIEFWKAGKGARTRVVKESVMKCKAKLRRTKP